MKPKVILRHCDSYDPAQIKSILLEGMDILGIQPHGRTLVKPNLVIPHHHYFAGCYTRPEFLDGLLAALKERGEKISELAVGENSAIAIPTRYGFFEAGYPKIIRKHRVRAVYFDEIPSYPVSLKHPDALHPTIFIPEAVTGCDFFVDAPKFKAHAWLKVTFSIKNYIGIQDDAHRMIDHDFSLTHKIADLQEVVSPGFIAVDAIQAGEYSEIAPRPFPLNLIVMGVNRVAVDSVCTHIIGLDPHDVEYIRLVAERGYGPIDLSEIELAGDVSLAEAQARCKNILLTLDRVDKILNGHGNITVYLGSPPQSGYWPGGCPGALLESTQISGIFQPEILQDIHPLSFIIGDYQGEIHPRPNEKIVALGDCACWSGDVNGNKIKVDPVYMPHKLRDPYHATAKNALQKSIDVMWTVFRQRRQPVVIVRGCPVPILEVTNILSQLGGVVNPSMKPDIFPRFVYFVLLTSLMRRLQRFRK